MFLIRGRNKTRQAVAPCPPTAAPSTSTSLSFRTSTSHSTSSSLPAGRVSVTPVYQLPTLTDGWVCDPAISALHFSYALTQAAEGETEADTDRCQLQSPRPTSHSPLDSPVSFLSLDGGRSGSPAHHSTTLTAATVPTTYRRVVQHNKQHILDTESTHSPHSHITAATNGSNSPGGSGSGSGSVSGGGSSRKADWLQLSLGRLAFRRRIADEGTNGKQWRGSEEVEVVGSSGQSSDKPVQLHVLQLRPLSLPSP